MTGSPEDRPTIRHHLASLAARLGPAELGPFLGLWEHRMQERLGALETAVAGGDAEVVGSIGHGLIGTAGVVGANQLVALARRLQHWDAAEAGLRGAVMAELRLSAGEAILAVQEYRGLPVAAATPVRKRLWPVPAADAPASGRVAGPAAATLSA